MIKFNTRWRRSKWQHFLHLLNCWGIACTYTFSTYSRPCLGTILREAFVILLTYAQAGPGRKLNQNNYSKIDFEKGYLDSITHLISIDNAQFYAPFINSISLIRTPIFTYKVLN